MMKKFKLLKISRTDYWTKEVAAKYNVGSKQWGSSSRLFKKIKWNIDKKQCLLTHNTSNIYIFGYFKFQQWTSACSKAINDQDRSLFSPSQIKDSKAKNEHHVICYNWLCYVFCLDVNCPEARTVLHQEAWHYMQHAIKYWKQES